MGRWGSRWRERMVEEMG
jgi:hypothetical protein